MKKEEVDWVEWWWSCFRDEDIRCLICGTGEEIVWHHISYRHDITVPLCRKCHEVWHSKYTTGLEASPEEIERALTYATTARFYLDPPYIIKETPLTETLLHEGPFKVQLRALMRVVFDKRKMELRPYLVLQAVLDGRVLESFSIPFTPAVADFLKRAINLIEREKKTINEKQWFYRKFYGPNLLGL